VVHPHKSPHNIAVVAEMFYLDAFTSSGTSLDTLGHNIRFVLFKISKVNHILWCEQARLPTVLSFSSKAVLLKITLQRKVTPSSVREIVNIAAEHSASIFKVHAYSSKVKSETTRFPEDYVVFITNNCTQLQ
jgi:hypothetical protein